MERDIVYRLNEQEDICRQMEELRSRQATQGINGVEEAILEGLGHPWCENQKHIDNEAQAAHITRK